jgi:hypothetical protein
MPELSRFLTAALLVSWSIALGLLCRLSPIFFWSFSICGSYIAARVFLHRTEQEDKLSLRYYMVRHSIVQPAGILTEIKTRRFGLH